MPKTGAYVTLKVMEDMLWFVCLYLEPRVAVANWNDATFVRLLGQAATPEGGECGPCPDFALYTLAFALHLKKSRRKSLVRASERFSADQRQTRFV